MNRKQRHALKKAMAQAPEAPSPNLQQLFAKALQQHQTGYLPEADRFYRGILAVSPSHADALHLLGVIAHQTGRNVDAVELIGKAIKINSTAAPYHSNLGIAFYDLGRIDDAAAAYGAAIRLKPDYAEAYTNLGNALKDLRRLDGAVAACSAAIGLRPDHAEGHSNRGNALLEQGRVKEAMVCYERALTCDPAYAINEMNFVFTHLYRPEFGLKDILARSRGWSRKHAEGFQWLVHGQSFSGPASHPDRLPRIGFVSADFLGHPVGLLVVPAIEGLARTGHHLTCYSNSVNSDHLTARFIAAATVWRPVAGLSDDALAAQVRADGIDILIDLSGYSAGNRMLVFARKPAPLLVAWLGYPATTGLAAMDYILADPFQVPAEAEAFFTEKIVRLPNCWVPFEPPVEEPSPGSPPVYANGWVTFGSFNALKKVTPEAVEVWSRILTKLPDSHLLLKAGALSCPASGQRYRALFAEHHVAPERLNIIGQTALSEHRAWMRRADIALDTFPFAGGITTLDALWSGLPVITLPGNTFSSRDSVGFLSNIGLSGLVASDADHYVEIALNLANDKARLDSIRSGLRSRILASPLCDVERFTSDLGAALTTMWHRCCHGLPAASFDLT